jgi:hypothetical protein
MEGMSVDEFLQAGFMDKDPVSTKEVSLSRVVS